MAWLLIGLVLMTVALWALAHYGVVLLVVAVLCAWHFLRSGRHG